MTRVLLIGKVGQLGWELKRTLATLGEITAVDYPEINLADLESVRQIVRQAIPQVIVNAAAYTAVDKAESEPDLANAINHLAPAAIAEEARQMGAVFVHYSTDYVYDGSIGRPYKESDSIHPLSVYGQSKLDGDLAIERVGGAFLIFRTAWVYSNRQGGFVNKVLQWGRQQKVMRVVSDQVSSPTWCRMLAEASAQVLAQACPDLYQRVGERRGVYNLAGKGSVSRLDWARAILQSDPKREEQVVDEILPTLTSEFPTPAARPLVSPLDCSLFESTFGLHVPSWDDSLRLALSE